MMGDMNINKYCVIEVLDPPYSDFDKYICVPISWVSFQNTLTGESAFAKFPIENLSDIKRRAKNGEDVVEDWPSFEVLVICCIDSYQHAIEFIKSNKKRILKRSCATNDENEAPVSTYSDKRTKSEVCKPKASVPFVNNSLSILPTDTEQKQLEETNQTTCDKQNKVYGTANSANNKVHFTRQARKASESVKMATPANSDNDLFQDNATPEAHFNDFSNVNITKISGSIAIPTQMLSNEHINTKEKADSLKKVYAEYLECYTIVDEIRTYFHENCALVGEMIDLITFNSKDNSVVLHAETVVSELINEDHNATTERQTVNESVSNENNQCDNDIIEKSVTVRDNENVLNNMDSNGASANQSKHRKFNLPKEYDENDSRWTLKHREMKEGLFELLPRSGVYVDLVQLNNIKRVSKERTTFAQMLLSEVFSENALGICSFHDKKANEFDPAGTNVRPVLDTFALNVLLHYVHKYGDEKNWPKIHDHFICGSLLSKMQEMRAKAMDRKL